MAVFLEFWPADPALSRSILDADSERTLLRLLGSSSVVALVDSPALTLRLDALLTAVKLAESLVRLRPSFGLAFP